MAERNRVELGEKAKKNFRKDARSQRVGGVVGKGDPASRLL